MTISLIRQVLTIWMALTIIARAQSPTIPEVFELTLQSQKPVSEDSANHHRHKQPVVWEASKTALILCDVWDSHHSINAVRRVQQIAPSMDRLANTIRSAGGTIIHAPSDCMPYYQNHPSRIRATQVPLLPETPETIANWCDQIAQESRSPYPVDQSDGGEDDDIAEHRQWLERLQSLGRDPKRPWTKQIETIRIDPELDYVSDSGKEIWNILKQRGIQHVVVCGVHTNMCVLGRPFGLRQLKQHGFEVVLVRDLTDTMYNPARWPYINHFSGTDRVIEHIERFVCPTVSSDQFLGGTPFRFQEDHRKHWAVMIAEDEYKTDQTLVTWSREQLEKDFRVSFIFSDFSDPNNLLGLDVLKDSDALLVSVRRRPLKPEQLKQIKDFIASGKPVLGIRTANHAFSLRGKSPSDGLADWPDFDAEVFGGSYTSHYGNDQINSVSVVKHTDHPLVLPKDYGMSLYESRGSLYKVSPLRPGTKVMWIGQIPNQAPEPVAWSFVRADTGRSFYIALGHESDFESDIFSAMLINAAHWLVGSPLRFLPADIEHQQHMVERGEGKQR